MRPLLEVRNLQITFTRYISGLKQHQMKAVDGVDLSLDAGTVTAVIGSSGSGKSLLAHAILGILPGNARMSGQILYRGEELDAARQEVLNGGEIAYIPQSVTYLDPTMRTGSQVRLAAKGDRREAAAKQRRVFQRYRLGEHVERLYPFELSGGMARRVLVAAATVSDARLIIADEPTPGLPQADVREALQQLRELADAGCGVLLITHDIQAALGVADRVVVFYAGSTVEDAHAHDFTGDGHMLRHPYSRALWRALPENGFEPLPGAQPHPSDRQAGCLFAPRCACATEHCREVWPEMRTVRGGMVRCHHAT